MPRSASTDANEPTSAASSTTRRRLGILFALLLLIPIVGLTMVAGLMAGVNAAKLTAGVLVVGAVLLLLAWLLAKMMRALLWRVGRRLAFSYFLIGVVPIPMVAVLVLINAYLLAGYFMGHLYRDANQQLRYEMTAAATTELSTPAPHKDDRFVFARYVDGRRVSGDDRLPHDWPDWLDQTETGENVSFVALRDGTPSLLASSGGLEEGVLVLFNGSLAEELSRRSEVWTELYRSDDPQTSSVVRLSLGNQEFALLPLAATRSGERSEFFGLQDGVDPPWLDRPMLWWGEIAGSVRSIEDGELISDYVLASLNGTISIVTKHLFSGSAEVDTAIWAAAISATVVLGAIYALALLMALFIIFTLSRAVNRLSTATQRVRSGDFATRIPVKRRDQIGELQRSFNGMIENLEQLVASEAQKELIEKELEIARELQESLLPTDLPDDQTLEFSTLFEPSAAIGGDYFDVLRIDEDRLAVVIADVSGHGLPTGLRMAMLKAALVILVEESKAPAEILRRLDDMVRAERRIFVTATIGIIDYRTGKLELTNAGHPPTYLVRDGEVEEILLPGNPLGTLGESYGHRLVDMQPGDLIVWLSDGLIEATNGSGEPFGYERIRDSLGNGSSTAGELRDHLVSAVSDHLHGAPADDDRTLVVMRFKEAGSPPEPAS